MTVTKRQAEKAREAIRAGQIIRRLQTYLLGKPETETCKCGREYEVFHISDETLKKLEPGQVRAGLGLLTHVLPTVQEVHQEDIKTVELGTETYDKMADYLKSSKRMVEELEKRGVKITFTEHLKAVK
ncbi:MAG: hypothetical protein GTN53_30880 [Candidatus Aminicenantes bacterium]|nr:hypothetical protein [Candidatus Aminicenantes bacterium]NIQ72099.1 hypothetical protein [Candidatus Aminicenantes bacterium]NIT26914.1 hypothetical protein [Candidatus Aminicenantes bacterium]